MDLLLLALGLLVRAPCINAYGVLQPPHHTHVLGWLHECIRTPVHRVCTGLLNPNETNKRVAVPYPHLYESGAARRQRNPHPRRCLRCRCKREIQNTNPQAMQTLNPKIYTARKVAAVNATPQIANPKSGLTTPRHSGRNPRNQSHRRPDLGTNRLPSG